MYYSNINFNYMNMKFVINEELGEKIKTLYLIDGLSCTKIGKYKQGISLSKLAKEYHTSIQTLSRKLKAKGIEIINHQNETKFNEHIFDVIDTEEKAYWLGFIFADGYISSRDNGFELSLKGSDIEHLHKFNKFMEHNKDNVKLGEVKNKDKIFLRCRWGIVNKHLWNTLNNLGCTPRKSLPKASFLGTRQFLIKIQAILNNFNIKSSLVKDTRMENTLVLNVSSINSLDFLAGENGEGCDTNPVVNEDSNESSSL